MLSFGVANDGLDRRAATHLAFDRFGDTARLVDPDLVAGRRRCRRGTPIGDDAVKAVMRIAGLRLGVATNWPPLQRLT